MEAYEAPEITEVGTIEQLTKAGFIGTKLDMDFPAGTEEEDLLHTSLP